MKRLFVVMLLAFNQQFVIAQEGESDDTPPSGGFQVERIFTGGNLNIGYFSGVTSLGATPQLGYSVTNWLDAGIVFGFTYTSQSDQFGTRYRQTIIGPGAFTRIFPVDFIFVTAQYEHNFLRTKVIYPGGEDVYKTGVNSLLLGLGYTQGRAGAKSGYYYFSVSIDVLDNRASPYRDFNNQIYPVVNAGFVIPLFQNRSRPRRSSE